MEMKDIKGRLHGWGQRAKEYLVTRFKKFSVMRWIGCLFLLLVAVICLMYAIMFTVNRAQGIPFFTDEDGKAMHTYEILVTIVFYLLGLFLLATWVYETFILPIKPKYIGPEKDIVGGRVIEIPRAEIADDKTTTQNEDNEVASDDKKPEAETESDDKKAE